MLNSICLHGLKSKFIVLIFFSSIVISNIVYVPDYGLVNVTILIRLLCLILTTTYVNL